MTTWALLLEYDGTDYVGWQRQKDGVSIQSLVEEAAAPLNGGVPPASIVAGRTDAGVHAAAQVAQLDLPDRHDADTVRDAISQHLKPHPIVVVAAAPAPPYWNARFSATARHYRYVILNRRSRPALDRHVWHVPHALDADRMDAAARHLLGRHDFTSFRAAACQAKSPVRTLDRLTVTRDRDRVVIEAGARSFLHHQVRNIVGTLRLVGDGAWLPERVAAALAARDRSAAGPTAPAAGLTLTRVEYPDLSFPET